MTENFGTFVEKGILNKNMEDISCKRDKNMLQYKVACSVKNSQAAAVWKSFVQIVMKPNKK